MAYKFSKGARGLGDITFEDDADTGIDFEADTIKLETGGAERVIVTNTDITLSGEVIVDQYIKHNGDNDTLINFSDDKIILKAGNKAMITLEEKGSAPHEITLNDGGNNIDFVVKGNGSNEGNPLLMCDASTGRVGINGIGSPDCELHVDGDVKVVGNDPRIKIDGDVDSHPGLELYENGARKWIAYNDYANDNLTFKTNTTIRMSIQQDGAVNVPISLRTPLIEYTDGDDAITIEDGGYLKFNAGVKYTRALRVSTGLSGGTDPQWIKIAASEVSGDDFDTSMSSFLVSMGGRETTTTRQIDGIFLVHVKFTARDDSPYYYPMGTYVVIEPLHADALAPTGGAEPFNDFDPTTDIFLTFETDSTPNAELWFAAPCKDKEMFVTHLGGTSIGDTSQIDPSFVIQTGQSWQTSEPGGLGTKVYGKWASKVFSKATIKETLETKAMKVSVRDVNSTSDIQDTDYVLRCIQTSGITLTLPPKSGNTGRVLIFKDMNGNAGSPNNHTITLDGDSSDTIDGSATYVVNANKESVTLTCDGVNGWMITSRVVP